MKGKLYFELPVSLIGREMLIGSTITEISDNDNAIVGSKPTQPILISFTKTKTHVQMREVNTDYISSGTNIDKAIEKSSIGAILKNAKIETYNNDSTAVVFEMTDFFVSDNKRMTPFDKNSLYGSTYNRSESFKSDCSYLTRIKAFKDNVLIGSNLSYTYSLTKNGTEVVKDEPFTVEMTRSILLLPEKAARPRYADYRIGIFYTPKMQLGEGSHTSGLTYYANRWQLAPSDTAAFLRGEKVEPIKPIVFYIDPNFPDSWRPAIKEGVNQWQEMFEKIGFKNAIIAKDFPTDDPEFDPDNIKYSCIRYAPIGIQNAMGPSWVDPRSGEILTASVYVYHDVVKLINQWMFVQTAAVDKRVRQVELPKEILSEAFRYVISHEVGHCLGFMHNMSGSSVIPVDSLRSPSFTQKYGTTTSIMDYARFNYVAQPGDLEKGVRMMPPRFGVYDEYLIRWNYTPVFNQTIEEEAKTTSQWITDSIQKNPWYRYGKQQFDSRFFDPRSQTEDLGDDAVKATQYGVKNLKYIMANFDSWITEGDDDYKFRTTILSQIINQFAMEAQHVTLNVGGLYKNEVKEGDKMPAFENIPTDKQVRALKYLFELYNDLDWLDNKTLMNKIAIMGSPKAAVADALGNMIFMTPFLVSLSADVSEKSFSFRECADLVYDFVWKPTIQGRSLNAEQMKLQKAYIEYMMKNGGFAVPGSNKRFAVTSTFFI
jgi:hypothetical protein